MQPILFVIPGLEFQIHSYGAMIFAACSAALLMAVWRSRHEGVESDRVYELAAWLFLGGVIGARVMFVIQHPEQIHQFTDIFRTWRGGNVFYGCILGGVLGSVLYWFRHPFPFLRMADCTAPGVAIGVAVGRIGCFLNGCCHGKVCDLAWGVPFPAGSHAWVRQLNLGLVSPESAWSLPVHPTQIYSSVAGLIVLAILLAFARRPHRPGEVIACLMVVFPLTRWPIESLRSDEPAVFAGMTWSQNISVALIAAGFFTWFLVRRLPRERTQVPSASKPRSIVAEERAAAETVAAC
jgi:phosphatidylglycerol:prolipoprotein diacylglycerol transferase